MEDYRVGMGRRMKEKRKLLHLTQEDMAELLDISVKHYSGVERGVAGLSLENLVYLSDILGMNLDYLVKGEGETCQKIPRTLNDIYVRCPEDKQEYLIEILESVSRFF